MITPLRQGDVKLRIAELEKETQNLEDSLRHTAKKTMNSLSPGNLLKTTFNEITGDAGLRNNLLNIALKFGLGIVGGRLFWKPQAGIAKKAIGAALQLGTSKAFSKNLIVWKNFVTQLFTKDK